MKGIDQGQFRLLMLSAMYENGGNTTQRLLDGHPELMVYPFESQLGTRHVNDHLTSVFPQKYRWPEFLLSATPLDDYRAIIDEEGKVRFRTPGVSKFRDYPIELDDEDRKERFLKLMGDTPRTRGAAVAAFFVATFQAWNDYRRPPAQSVCVGYSPIVVVDALKIVEDLPQAHVLHVVRNPWSAFAETQKRPVPLSLQHYNYGWLLNQLHALAARQSHPDRVHIVRYEDLVADPKSALRPTLEALGVNPGADSLETPTWNGQTLAEVYPWGTIRTPTEEANAATARELSPGQTAEITAIVEPLLARFGYRPPAF